MKRLTMSLGAIGFFGLAVWGAQAAPLSSAPVISVTKSLSPWVQVGCARPGDNCPYGERIVRGGGGWWCEPCGSGYYRHGHYRHNYNNWDRYGSRDYEGMAPRYHRY
jgi:hypothetical protein